MPARVVIPTTNCQIENQKSVTALQHLAIKDVATSGAEVHVVGASVMPLATFSSFIGNSNSAPPSIEEEGPVLTRSSIVVSYKTTTIYRSNIPDATGPYKMSIFNGPYQSKYNINNCLIILYFKLLIILSPVYTDPIKAKDPVLLKYTY